MRSAFGIDHGEMSKAYGNIAGRLERVAASAAPGSREHAYATARLHAGGKAASVAQHAKTLNTKPKPGARNFISRQKLGNAQRSAYVQSHAARMQGAGSAQSARGQVPGKTPGGIGRMESQAAERLAPNKPRFSTGAKIGAGALGAGGAGGYAYSQKRKS